MANLWSTRESQKYPNTYIHVNFLVWLPKTRIKGNCSSNLVKEGMWDFLMKWAFNPRHVGTLVNSRYAYIGWVHAPEHSSVGSVVWGYLWAVQYNWCKMCVCVCLRMRAWAQWWGWAHMFCYMCKCVFAWVWDDHHNMFF